MSQNLDEDEVDEEGNLSDASQYIPSVPANDSSCPLSIIPINNKTSAPPSDYNPKRKRKSDDEEVFQRRACIPNLKPMKKMENHDIPALSFTTKQSVEIFPISNIKSEKNDDSYEPSGGNRESLRMEMKEYSIRSPDQGLNEMPETYGTVEENYQKNTVELSEYHLKIRIL